MEHGPHRHACGVPGGPRWVGDPVDVITGENVFSKKDLTVPGPVAFQFRRNYNHTWAGLAQGIGRGFRHSFDHWLCFDVDGLTYFNAEGGEIQFPFLDHDGDAAASGGYSLRRESAGEYHVSRHAQPTRVFRPSVDRRAWPLAELRKEGGSLRLAYERRRLQAAWIDEHRCLWFVYGEHGQITELQLRRTGEDPLPLIKYRYDAHQRLVEGIDVYKQRFGCGYDAAHRLTERVDEGGYRFHFEYDRSNRCIASHGEDGLLSVQMKYDLGARQTTVIDANGADWLYEYDDAQNLLSVTDPYGGVTLYERGPGSELVAEVDPEGRRTEYLRDAAGAQIAKRLPNGIVVPLPEGPSPPDPDAHRVPGIAIEWEYGDLWDLDFGLPDQYELPELPPSVRDALTTSESPQRGRVEEVRDQAGLLTREVLEDGSKRRYGYTHRGKVRRLRDFDGSDYKLETRSWDLPWRATDPLGHVTEYEYTNTAELSEVIDPAGNRVHYSYDLKDRIASIGRNVTVHDRYEYDGSDNLVAKYDGNGRQLLELEYDGHGRLIRRELFSGDTHTFDYDEQGWVTRAATHQHTVEFAHDAWRRRTRDERDGKGIRHRFVGAQLARTTTLGRFDTEYHALDDGTVVIVDPSGATHRIRRHGRGVFTRDLANGWSETAQYSPRGWCLSKVAYATDAPDRAWARKYLYSGEGDLQRVIDTDKGVTQHHHDQAHRLVGTTHPNGAQDAYRYTKSGSLTHKPGLNEGTVGHLNQLRWADGHQLEYGLRQHVSVQTTPDGHRLEYKHDARDQLIAVRWNGHDWWSADYDAIGRRIRKTVAGQTHTYHWDTDRLAAETLPDGRLRVYVYPDAFAMVPLLFVDYESEDADPASGQRYYLFTDQRGCPEKVVDDAGDTVWEAYVEPYGTAHVLKGHDFYQPLRFPGHWWDPELGLHYNRFRYYSPWLGRYLQVDRIGEQGGTNVYAYASDPLGRVDLRGLNPNSKSGCGGGGGQQVSEREDGGDSAGTPDPTGAEVPSPPRAHDGPRPVIDDNIGAGRTPEDAARIMHERTRRHVEEQAAERARRVQSINDREGQRAPLRARERDAAREVGRTGRRVGETQRDPTASDADRSQALREHDEARAAHREAAGDLADFDDANPPVDRAPSDSGEPGRVYEPAYDPDTGRMVVTSSGPEPASSRIGRPSDDDSLADSTRPGRCGMPRAAGILVDDAAEAGRERPSVVTTQGGYSFDRDGTIQHVNQCENCADIAGRPENRIQTAGGLPDGVSTDTRPGARTSLDQQ